MGHLRSRTQRSVKIGGNSVPHGGMHVNRPGHNVVRVKNKVTVNFRDLTRQDEPDRAIAIARMRVDNDIEFVKATGQLGATYYFEVFARSRRLRPSERATLRVG